MVPWIAWGSLGGDGMTGLQAYAHDIASRCASGEAWEVRERLTETRGGQCPELLGQVVDELVSVGLAEEIWSSLLN